MEHCDFSQQKVGTILHMCCHLSNHKERQYVRDCLEVLRLGAGLDNGQRLRRGKMDEWKYIYMEHERDGDNLTDPSQVRMGLGNGIAPRPTQGLQDRNAGLSKKPGPIGNLHWMLREPLKHVPYSSLPSPCDEETPAYSTCSGQAPLPTSPTWRYVLPLYSKHRHPYFTRTWQTRLSADRNSGYGSTLDLLQRFRILLHCATCMTN
jgi:WD repeat and SOF domain-containing protein 1